MGQALQPLLVTALAATTAAMAIRPIPIPHRMSPTTERVTVMGRTTAATVIRATPPHLTIPALLSASGGVISQFLEHTSEVRSRGQAEL